MNILEQEDIIKGLPDQALMKEASAPSGEVPQFLVVSEIKRRNDMRKRYESQQQQNQGTVKDQILSEAMGGIAGMMPPQMAPQQLAMAPMGAPPMGGMPPQGMPPMAPPQPPMGGISSMPQGMPPMGMAQGGIVQMSGADLNTGQVPGMPALPAGQYRLFDGTTIAEKMQELLGKVRGGELAYADVLAGISSIKDSDARELALSYVQSEVGGEGAGMEPVGGTTEMDTTSALTQGISGLSELGGKAGRFLTEDISRSLAPIRSYEAARSQRVSDAYDQGGVGAEIGQLVREAPGSVSNVLGTALTDLGNVAGAGLTAFANLSPIADSANFLDQLVTGSTDDPFMILDRKDDASVQGASRAQVQANGMLSEYTDYAGLLPAVAGDEVAAQSPYTLEYLQELNATQRGRDAAKKDLNRFAGETIDNSRMFGPGIGTGTSDVKGESTRETKLIDAVASQSGNDRSVPDMPALDFSDLIAEGKQQALANAMIQLGAGVASGDVAKGISAAGTAAMKGTADARALDMRSRLAEYQAGREDIRRGEEADRFERKMTAEESQFSKQLEQLERKISATIDVSNATTQRENLRALAGEVASLREQALTMSPTEKAKFGLLESRLYEMLGLDMSAPVVTSGLSGKDDSGLRAFFK